MLSPAQLYSNKDISSKENSLNNIRGSFSDEPLRSSSPTFHKSYQSPLKTLHSTTELETFNDPHRFHQYSSFGRANHSLTVSSHQLTLQSQNKMFFLYYYYYFLKLYFILINY